MAAVTVDELRVVFDDVVAVDGLTFSVDRGEVVSLLGPNGAGKTSTVETLEGFRRPDGGAVQVLGLDPVDDHRELMPRVGAMLQEGGVHPGARALEMLELFAAFHQRSMDPAELLHRVGLAGKETRSWRQLSGGEQQRLSLALALIGRPEVAFLDEPTAGVDVGGRHIVRSILAGLRRDGVAVLVTTHDLEEAERVSDRIVIVDDGHLVTSGTPTELTTGGDRIRFGAAPGIDIEDLSEALGVPVVEEPGGEYVVEAESTPNTVAALTAWLAARDVPLGDLRAGRQRLEDVFLRLTTETSAAEPSARPARSR